MSSPSSGPSPVVGGGDVKNTTVVEGGVTWVDIPDPDDEDMAKLARDYHFHPLDLEDCLSPRQLTKVEDHGEHMFISLHFPEEPVDGIITSGGISMFLGRNYLVTVRQSSFERLSAIVNSLKTEVKGRGEPTRTPAYLAYLIIDRLVDGIYAVIDDVQASLDAIEVVVFDEKRSSAEVINKTRREIAVLRRIIYPLALYLPDLTKAQKFSDEDLSIYFSDLRHKVAKASRVTDEMKEMVEIYKDTDFVRSSNRTNWVLSILTIIFTLTIPATVVSSIYGMNVPLPGGAVTGPTGVFGLYTSMIFLFAAMLIPAGLMGWYFKRVGWI
jgi:magnesium transporter